MHVCVSRVYVCFLFTYLSFAVCVGPFMIALFAKLENMLQNSLYVNILLTGIVAQLACYPQPLLRSFLLNTNMVFQPSVKSLIQVLKNQNKQLSIAIRDSSQDDVKRLCLYFMTNAFYSPVLFF